MQDGDELVTRAQLVDALNIVLQGYPTTREMVAVVNEGLRRHDARRHRSAWRRLRDWWRARKRVEFEGMPKEAPSPEMDVKVPSVGAGLLEQSHLLVPDTRLVGVNGEPL